MIAFSCRGAKSCGSELFSIQSRRFSEVRRENAKSEFSTYISGCGFRQKSFWSALPGLRFCSAESDSIICRVVPKW